MPGIDRRLVRLFVVGLIATAVDAPWARAAESSAGGLDPRQLAARVTIYRDAYGMPHIDGANDEAVLFGFGYCQAEDYFWQIEDSYVMGLGRYVASCMAGNSWPRTCATARSRFRSARKTTSTSSSRSRAEPAQRSPPASTTTSTTHPASQAAAARAHRALVSAGLRPRRHARAGRRAHARVDRRGAHQLRRAEARRRGPRSQRQQRLGDRRQPARAAASRCC